jgi:hypothetical protein
MSRSGYIDDGDQSGIAMWRGQVASAIRGKRGQAFLRELIEALDARPEKKLIVEDLERGGEVCALGAVGVKRGIDMGPLNPYDTETLAGVFGIAHQLVAEIEFMNDEGVWAKTPEERWQGMRDWAVKQLKRDASSTDAATP